MIKGIEINRLFARGCLTNRARPCFVFDDNSQTPAIVCVQRRDFKRRYRSHFTQILTLFIAQMELAPDRNLPSVDKPPSTES
jgi:hypothetical protein